MQGRTSTASLVAVGSPRSALIERSEELGESLRSLVILASLSEIDVAIDPVVPVVLPRCSRAPMGWGEAAL